jgi:hypothetical protein
MGGVVAMLSVKHSVKTQRPDLGLRYWPASQYIETPLAGPTQADNPSQAGSLEGRAAL